MHRLLRDGVHDLLRSPRSPHGPGDTKLGQEVFYPYNATNLSPARRSYYYYTPGGSCPSASTVSNYTPVTYHSWISALNFTPTNTKDKNLYKGTSKLGAYLSNPSTATVNEYYRLEVDTLQWNGSPTCAATAGPCSYPSTGTDVQSEAHKGYSVRLVSDNGSPTIPSAPSTDRRAPAAGPPRRWTT